MKKVEPEVFCVAETKILSDDLIKYLKFVGVSEEYLQAKSNLENNLEYLIEFMGRLCYRSWEPKLNPNVTKVREDQHEYLQNIIKSGHGSVLEHASVSFVFANVSRVFTHELVRHRAGTAISQESLRFVRLTDLGFWFPTCIKENKEAVSIMSDTVEHLEGLQVKLADLFNLDDSKIPFSQKKVITSALRRIAPIGLSTTIGWTANIRTLRHVLEMRTSPHAEEEIRCVFSKVGKILINKYPKLFSDYVVEEVDGYDYYSTENKKV